MYKRKYVSFIIATDVDEHETESFREAVSSYRHAESATLYGVYEDRSMTVIYAK